MRVTTRIDASIAGGTYGMDGGIIHPCEKERSRSQSIWLILSRKRRFCLSIHSSTPANLSKYPGITAIWYIDGKSTYAAMVDAIKSAKKEIFITDWFLSPGNDLNKHQIELNSQKDFCRTFLDKRRREGGSKDAGRTPFG